MGHWNLHIWTRETEKTWPTINFGQACCKLPYGLQSIFKNSSREVTYVLWSLRHVTHGFWRSHVKAIEVYLIFQIAQRGSSWDSFGLWTQAWQLLLKSTLYVCTYTYPSDYTLTCFYTCFHTIRQESDNHRLRHVTPSTGQWFKSSLFIS